MSKRAAIYARISQTDDEVDKVEGQVSDCRKLAQSVGYEVVAVHEDDDISAYQGKANRPGFIALLNGLSESRYDVVLATESMRLTRGAAAESEALQAMCVKAGAFIHLTRGGIQTVDNAQGRFVLGIMDLVGGLEVGIKTERQTARYDKERAAGMPLWGMRPFGYEDDRITVRESEAVHIRNAYRSALDDGATVWKIAQEWNRLGLRTDTMGKKRKNNLGQLKEVPAVWTTTTVRQMLTRPRNAGILRHKGADMPNSQIEAIVTEQEWRDLCAAIKGDPQASGPKPQYLLGGILECPCGATMHASKSTTKRKTGQRYESKIYRCRLYGMDKSQPHANIALKIADDYVSEYVVLDLGHGYEPEADPNASRMAELQVRLGVLAGQEERATNAYVDGIGNATKLKGRLRTINAEQQALQAERAQLIAAAAHSSALADFRAQMAQLDKWRSDDDFETVFAEGMRAWKALPMDERRAIIRGGYKVTVGPGRGVDRIVVS